MFSSFTTPMLASLFGAGFYVVGHLTRDLRELGASARAAGRRAATALLHRVLPDLEAFNVTIEAVHGLPIPARGLAAARSTAPATRAGSCCSPSLVFERRDFR